jgi:phosphoribosylamine--glycine ligase
MAFMATRDGVKILEINSRLGDPESMAWLRLLKTSFVDICLDMINGKLKPPEFENRASVVKYLVRPDYAGGKRKPESTAIDITKALKVAENYGDSGALYLGAVKKRDDGTYEALGSRNIAAFGAGETIEEARYISDQICEAVIGDLESRSNIASPEHITGSIKHMQSLRA